MKKQLLKHSDGNKIYLHNNKVSEKITVYQNYNTFFKNSEKQTELIRISNIKLQPTSPFSHLISFWQYVLINCGATPVQETELFNEVVSAYVLRVGKCCDLS